jgi:endonuclease YncB( thermonuclease family)
MVRPRTAITLVLAFALPLLAMDSHAAYEIVGLAFVKDDATLLIRNHVVHLYGIYIPPAASNVCLNRNEQERHCGPGAALDYWVNGFLHCYPQEEYDDGSLSAVCYANRTTFSPGDDLAAYLIQQGYALATPDAPSEYRAYESAAQSQGLGVWGIPVDTINRQPFRGRR